MKRLLLLRHGEAEPASAAASDFERALTPHGRDQALQAAHRLRQVHCVPATILASPALRARETATIVAALLARLQGLRYEASAYPGSPETLLQLLSGIPEEIESLLLVGHNPGLSTLARRFAAGAVVRHSTAEHAAAGSYELSTGGLCRVGLSSWSSIESSVTDVTLLSR